MNWIKLPKEVAALYSIVQDLEAQHPGRKFTLDGHLVGSIGEVIAERSFGIELYPASHAVHDGRTSDGRDVQIKLTGGKSISLREEPDYLLVMKIVDPQYAEVVYNGPGSLPWSQATRMQKNGQRPIGVAKLRALDGFVALGDRLGLPA